jgi:hypothetical protein
LPSDVDWAERDREMLREIERKFGSQREMGPEYTMIDKNPLFEFIYD